MSTVNCLCRKETDTKTAPLGLASSPHGPQVVSVNVGEPRTVDWHGHAVSTAIWKEPVEGSVNVEGVNLAGDDQSDRRVHGGTDKAVYSYSVEDYAWWEQTSGVLGAGTFGENLTTRGIDLGSSGIGDRWHVGSAVLEVSQPRSPCFKLGIRMSDDDFPLRFMEAGRPGAYLRIIEPGRIAAGDAIKVQKTQPPALTIRSLAAKELDVAVLKQAAVDDRVPLSWRRWAARQLEG